MMIIIILIIILPTFHFNATSPLTWPSHSVLSLFCFPSPSLGLSLHCPSSPLPPSIPPSLSSLPPFSLRVCLPASLLRFRRFRTPDTLFTNQQLLRCTLGGHFSDSYMTWTKWDSPAATSNSPPPQTLHPPRLLFFRGLGWCSDLLLHREEFGRFVSNAAAKKAEEILFFCKCSILLWNTVMHFFGQSPMAKSNVSLTKGCCWIHITECPSAGPGDVLFQRKTHFRNILYSFLNITVSVICVHGQIYNASRFWALFTTCSLIPEMNDRSIFVVFFFEASHPNGFCQHSRQQRNNSKFTDLCLGFFCQRQLMIDTFTGGKQWQTPEAFYCEEFPHVGSPDLTGRTPIKAKRIYLPDTVFSNLKKEKEEHIRSRCSWRHKMA